MPKLPGMERIYPRSPREIMDGWCHLPRFIDKIRLHLAGKLHSDYQPNFTKGFDGAWLKAAGVSTEQIIALVKESVCDGQVCDWVRSQVKKSPDEKQQFNDSIARYGREGDLKERLKLRKEQAGLADRDDIQCFFDLIEIDEKRH
jgi:hypothetical protein